MEFEIRLNSVEDAVTLVNKLEYYNCHADALVDNQVIDARALMGLLEFGIGRTMLLVVYSGVQEGVKQELYRLQTA